MSINDQLRRGMQPLFALVLSVLALSLSILISANLASAQEYRATVEGSVTDASGAAVPGAEVTLKNTNTGVVTVQRTNATGRYIFKAVQPGKYSVAVRSSGFQRFIAENVTVETFGDVTVDAQLKVGSIAQSVTVSGQADLMQFNTSSVSTIVEGAALTDIPLIERNPFTLALLDPSVVNRYAGTDLTQAVPYYDNSSNGQSIGGPSWYKNNLTVDGSPLSAGGYGSYTPSMEGVQEFSVQENAIDAEYGFSSGAAMSVTTKSGTNQFHGTAYYFGQNSDLNAITNRITRSSNVIHNNQWGASLGNPIIRNKLFNYFDYEQWRAGTPQTWYFTEPTAAEKQGDFSGALTPQGAQRVIYDPTTTVYNPATSTVTRTPFPHNIIPASRMDATGAMAVGQLWLPNGPGDDPSGVNNFKLTNSVGTRYLNYSERMDYDRSNAWRFYGRFSKFRAPYGNATQFLGIATPNGIDGTMGATNVAGDALWLLNPQTTVDFRFGYTRNQDDYGETSAQVSQSVWSNLWPNSNWYQPVIAPIQSTGLYYPGFFYNGLPGQTTGTGSPYGWLVHNRDFSPSVGFTHDKGRNYMKWGWQLRYQVQKGDAQEVPPGTWNFNSIDTGNTFLSSYNSSQSGDVYASALLGVVDSGTAVISPIVNVHTQEWGVYFQDDLKLNRRVTLNLGLRWEREPAPAEAEHRLVQTINLNTPLPALQGITMPSQVTALATVPYKFDGAMIYTSGSSPRLYDATWGLFLPRVGAAVRINDKTAFRAGYARSATPFVADTLDSIYYPYNGYVGQTSVISPVEGVPQTYLSNPYPASNPVVLPVGNSLGIYSGVGNPVEFWEAGLHPTPETDRINFSLQRQAPEKFFLDATFYMAFIHNYMQGLSLNSYNVNQMNPQIAYNNPGLTEQAVPNPFYGLPRTVMPGSLSSEPEVPASQLLSVYPQYGALSVNSWPGDTDHYYALQLKAQRQMANGLMFIVAYSYNRETQGQFFNPEDTYNDKYTMLDPGSPRHQLRFAGDWQLPIGRGRAFLNNMPRVLEAMVGGWSTAGLFRWQSGNLLMFGPAQVTCNPTQNVPSGHYFNPACFSVLPADTPRTNPWYYPGLNGQHFWQLDQSLVKYFNLTREGRVKLELRMEFYNLPNSFVPGDPDTNVGSGTMGRSVTEYSGNYGRQIQYTGRIHF